MNKLILKDCRFLVTLGQFDPEKLQEQEIFIDLEVSFDMKKCMQTDDVKDAVCYDEIYKKRWKKKKE